MKCLVDVFSSHLLPLCNSTDCPGMGEDGEGVNTLKQGAGDDSGSRFTTVSCCSSFKYLNC